MHVNNEVGTIQPIDEVAANKRNAIFHTDAVQSFGKIPLITENVDIITVSGHKIHGPKGIGSIAIKKGLNISPLILGGGQEKHFRSGTENMPACVGLGLAAEMTCENLNEKMRKMSEVRSYLLQGIKEEIKDIKINSPDNSCPSILNISFLGTRGEVILHYPKEADIIRKHMKYSTFSPINKIDETDVVCLADRICKEDKYVGVDERMEYIFRKNAGFPERQQIILDKKEELKKYINDLESVIGCSIDKLMENKISSQK